MFWYGSSAAFAIPYGYTEDCGPLENSGEVCTQKFFELPRFATFSPAMWTIILMSLEAFKTNFEEIGSVNNTT
jgi:hypothetical protein